MICIIHIIFAYLSYLICIKNYLICVDDHLICINNYFISFIQYIFCKILILKWFLQIIIRKKHQISYYGANCCC